MADKKHEDSPLVVHGIKVKLTVADVDDYEVTEALVDMSDEDKPETDCAKAIVRLTRLLFGRDWERIKGELRKKHDGKLTNETVGNFITDVFTGLNRKNS